VQTKVNTGYAHQSFDGCWGHDESSSVTHGHRQLMDTPVARLAVCLKIIETSVYVLLCRSLEQRCCGHNPYKHICFSCERVTTFLMVITFPEHSATQSNISPLFRFHHNSQHHGTSHYSRFILPGSPDQLRKVSFFELGILDDTSSSGHIYTCIYYSKYPAYWSSCRIILHFVCNLYLRHHEMASNRRATH